MKMAALILFVVVFVAATLAPSEARHYRHGRCSYGPYHDYNPSNFLSPLSYVFPAANWAPFFHCRMYYSPVEPPPPPDWY